MNDLNKTPKTLHTSLDGTVKEVEKLDTRENDEIFKAFANDMELIKKHKRSWTMGIMIEILVDTFIPILMMIEKSSSIWDISIGLDIIVTFTATLFFLAFSPGNDRVFSKTKRIKIKGLFLKKAVYFILAWVPWYFCIVIRFEVDPIKTIWITPISFVAFLIYLLVARRDDPMGLNGISIEDYRRIRRNQIAGGLNPDALPPVFMNSANKDAIMRMSPQDWNRLGHRLKQAGYRNVLRRGR